MDRPTRMQSYRLTPEAIRLLELLASAYGINKTAMLEIMIRDKGRAESWRLDGLERKIAQEN